MQDIAIYSLKPQLVKCEYCGIQRNILLASECAVCLTKNFTKIIKDGKKGCSRCNKNKPIKQFSKNSTNKCGYRSECKECFKKLYA